VRTGVLRGSAPICARYSGGSVGNAERRLLAGIGVTGLLQSSTATALLTSSFVGQAW